MKEDMTFEEFALIWKDHWLKKRNIGEATKLGYEYILKKRILPVIGNMRLLDICASDIDNLVDEMISLGYSAKTIRNTFSVLKLVIKWAFNKGYIGENICDRCDELPRDKKVYKVHYFTPDQAKIFLKELEKYDIRLRTFFTLAIYGGFRRGELCALMWNDLDFEKRQIRICHSFCMVGKEQVLKSPKTAAGVRTVSLPKECFDLLLMMPVLGEFVFTRKRSIEPMPLQAPTTEFRRILVNYNKGCGAGEELPLIRLHDLRHTSATLLIGCGTDIETVAHRLGHSHASVTLDIYAHALPSNDAIAAGKLSMLLR